MWLCHIIYAVLDSKPNQLVEIIRKHKHFMICRISNNGRGFLVGWGTSLEVFKQKFNENLFTVLWRWLLHPVRSRPLQPQGNPHTVYYKRSSFIYFITTWRWVVVWVWGSSAWIGGKTSSLLLLLVQCILYNLSHCHVGVPKRMKKKKQTLDKWLSFKLEMTSTFHRSHPLYSTGPDLSTELLFNRSRHI